MEGFEFDGGRQPLSSKAEGIYKPKGHPLVLTVKTTMPRTGRTNPYSDELDATGTLIRYSYKSVNGSVENAANAALRLTMRLNLPIVYFCALAPAVYAAIAPVFVVQDNPSAREFLLAPGTVLADQEVPTHVHTFVTSPPDKRYVARIVLQRVHQRAFRNQVLTAYQHHCAMCSIHFEEFLEAAHIVPDNHALGVPEVSNGLSLCGLHHKAFDRFLVDVDDDYRVRISPELLSRRNGPLFRQAFLEREGEPINLPNLPLLHPSVERLRQRRAIRAEATL